MIPLKQAVRYSIMVCLTAFYSTAFAQWEAKTDEELRSMNALQRFWWEFNYTDTAYVEPNHYNLAFMLQNTNTYESLSLTTKSGNRSFSSDPVVKLGPYLGWRWLFFGYTFAMNDAGRTKFKRTEWEVGLYGTMMGCDLIYRKTGSDFKWRDSGNGELNVPYGDYAGSVNIRTIGINAYYIFNHRRFSHPSLFSQSTVQKRSQGSWMVGLAITSHKYEFDATSWPSGIDIFANNRKMGSINYMDYAISAGYSYNWVIRKNLMLGLTLTPAIGFKHLTADSDIAPSNGNWVQNNLNFDITGRAALVWNNNTYYAGMSLIVHNYNFSRSNFGIHNTFGTLNFYVGLNFLKRKQYKRTHLNE